MKELVTIALIATQLVSFSHAQTTATDKFPAGIVYGPKGAYKIDAPQHWVLDNKSGTPDGLPCVLYIDGYTWQNSPVIMYAKIASPEYPDLEKFIDFSLKEFEKEDSNFYHKELKNGNTGGNKYIIMDYRGGVYKSFERTFYVQMEKAVGYIVFSARNSDDYDKYADSIFEIAKSYQYIGKFDR